MKNTTKVALPGQPNVLVDAVDVGIAESTERWTDIQLEDGSSLRLKSVIVGVHRLENQYDQDGNPAYLLKANQIMVVVKAPDHLRKGGAAH